MEMPAKAQSAPVSEKMSYEEFLAWCDEDTRAEWVDGEVVIMSPASDPHQNLADFLIAVLRIFVETRDLGWVRSAPFQMRLERIARGREPDILFVRKERMNLVQPTYLDGPADLVIEITSPESLLRDRGEKFAEYELAGVPEYWLLDPQRKRADFYLLGPDGRYRLAAVDEEGMYRSQVLQGFWLNVAWLWQDPLPRVLDILEELGVTS
jgi:Uma2 family endonuclease